VQAVNREHLMKWRLLCAALWHSGRT